MGDREDHAVEAGEEARREERAVAPEEEGRVEELLAGHGDHRVVDERRRQGESSPGGGLVRGRRPASAPPADHEDGPGHRHPGQPRPEGGERGSGGPGSRAGSRGRARAGRSTVRRRRRRRGCRCAATAAAPPARAGGAARARARASSMHTQVMRQPSMRPHPSRRRSRDDDAPMTAGATGVTETSLAHRYAVHTPRGTMVSMTSVHRSSVTFCA